MRSQRPLASRAKKAGAKSVTRPRAVAVDAPEFRHNQIRFLPKKPYVVQNGRPAPRKWRRFTVVADDGQEQEVTLVSDLLTQRPGLAMGKRTLVEPVRFPGYLVVPIYLPLGLIAVGGILGGAIGGGAVGVNGWLATTRLPTALKIVSMVAAAAVATGLWYAAAVLLLARL